MKKIKQFGISKFLKNNSDLCIQENRGITLIALIVTIIVMLIIAGVATSMLTRRKWHNYKSTKIK